MSVWGTISKASTAATSFVWRRVFCPIFRLAYYALIAFLVLWAFTVVTLVATHICLIFNKGPLKIFRWWPDLILTLLFGIKAEQLAESQYSALVSDMLAAFAFVVTVGVVVQSVLYKRRVHGELVKAQEEYEEKVEEAKQKFEQKMGITSQPIRQEGKDDLIWMLPHYKEGDRVTVFAGGFGWLATNSEMKNRILELAADDKLSLVSYRTKEQVKDSFERKNAAHLFENLKDCFRFESGLDGLNKVICTMIQLSATEWRFLYKSLPDEEGHAFNACVLSDTDSNRQLLHILSQLTRADRWGTPDC